MTLPPFEWQNRKPILSTKWRRGDVVQVKRFGPQWGEIGQVLTHRIPDRGSVIYTVRIFRSSKRLVIDNYKAHELAAGDVDPLTFLALQALPDNPEEGMENT